MVGGVDTSLSVIGGISLWPLQTWEQAEGTDDMKCCNFGVVQVVPAKNRNSPQTGLRQRPQPSPRSFFSTPLVHFSSAWGQQDHVFFIAALSFPPMYDHRGTRPLDKESAALQQHDVKNKEVRGTVYLCDCLINLIDVFL